MNLRLKPIIYVAFANPADTPALALPGLMDEEANIKDALKDAIEDDSSWEYESGLNSTRAGLVERFYSNRVAVFHYGGHADPQHLLLPGESAGRQLSNAVLLEDFLARQESLKFAFFNACSTREWAQNLVRLGVPCIIATARPVQDRVALGFATAFYQCLAADSTIQEAFDKAKSSLGFTDEPSAIPSAGGVHRSIDEADDAASTAADFPWAIYARDASASAWKLSIGAHDPLIGLPPLVFDKDKLPDSPYVSIKGHTPADAPLFFGRNAEIRSLYDWILRSPGDPPILLFYGQSGVGKSSLLSAGLLPRLNGQAEVVSLRRNLNLTSDLYQALGGSGDDAVRAWLTGATPRLIILDQVEEAMTHNDGSTAELHAFIATLIQIFSRRPPDSKARLILSFRKEYLAEIRNALTAGTAEGDTPLVKDFWLERLDFDGVMQVVSGPVRSRALKEKYRITMADENLPAEIAHDLEDRNSPIATVLQIILNQLWKAALKQGGDPVYSRALYQSLKDVDNPLQGFFDEQRAKLEPNAGGVMNGNGLELDLLYEHTTQLVTSKRVLLSDLKKAYPQIPNIEFLIARNKELQLLSDPVDEQGAASNPAPAEHATSLAHDTLAPIIRREFELSVLPGSRARRLLENRARDWAPAKENASAEKGEKQKPRRDTLDGPDLRVVENGLSQMRSLTDPEALLLAASRQRRSRQRMTALALTLAIAIGASASGYKIWDDRRKQAQSQRDIAEEQQRTREQTIRTAEQARLAAFQAKRAAVQAQIAVSRKLARAVLSNMDTRYDLAALLSVEALNAAQGLEPEESYDARNAALAVFQSKPFPARSIHASPRDDSNIEAIAFSPDGRRLLTASSGGVMQLWDAVSARQLWAGSIKLESAPGDPSHPQSSTVAFAAFSPDGTTIALASKETIQLWRSKDHQMIGRPLLNPPRNMQKVAFSPDGSLLAACGEPGIQVWDMATHKPLRPLSSEPSAQRFNGLVWSFAFSQAGRQMAAVTNLTVNGESAAAVTIEDPRIGPSSAHLVTAKKRDGIQPIDLSADGARLAVGAGADGNVEVWDLRTNSLQGVIDTAGAIVMSVAFVANDNWLAVATWKNGVSVWDVKTLKKVGALLNAGEQTVHAMVYSARQQTLALATDNEDALLIPLGDPVRTEIPISPHATAPVIQVAYSPDGRWIAMASADGAVRLWDTIRQVFAAQPWPSKTKAANSEFAVTSLAFSKDSTVLAFCLAENQNSIHLWDVKRQRVLDNSSLATRASSTSDSLANAKGEQAAAFNRSGELLAASNDGWVQRWNPLTHVQLGRFPGRDNTGLYALAIAPDDHAVAAAGFSAAGFRLWDGATHQLLPHQLQSDGATAFQLAFSPDSSKLAAAGGLSGVFLWNVATGQRIGSAFPIGQKAVERISFSPDGQQLALSIDGGTVRLWDVATQQEIGVDLQAAAGGDTDASPGGVAFSPDGRRIAFGTADGTVALFKAFPADWPAQACKFANRNFTLTEWQSYFGAATPYRRTCPQLPDGDGVSPARSAKPPAAPAS